MDFIFRIEEAQSKADNLEEENRRKMSEVRRVKISRDEAVEGKKEAESALQQARKEAQDIDLERMQIQEKLMSIEQAQNNFKSERNRMDERLGELFGEREQAKHEATCAAKALRKKEEELAQQTRSAKEREDYLKSKSKDLEQEINDKANQAGMERAQMMNELEKVKHKAQ